MDYIIKPNGYIMYIFRTNEYIEIRMNSEQLQLNNLIILFFQLKNDTTGRAQYGFNNILAIIIFTTLERDTI